MRDLYKKEIIDPGDLASRLAHKVCVESYDNCPAVRIIPPQSGGNFRGPVGHLWRRHILKKMLNYEIDSTGKITSWTMSEGTENDGAGGKPQFLTLIGTPEVFRGLGWEIITMTADDFARSGRFPAIISNEINTKGITEDNLPLFESMMKGYGEALEKSNLVNITGETAIMQDSVTAFCDCNSRGQLILNWGASCLGLAHRDLLIDSSRIRSEMPIVGFPEPGYRCNGGTFFTNLILEKFGPDIESIRDNREALEFIKKLTIPSQSYAKTVARTVGWKEDGRVGDPLADIAGIAHITGGGIWSKFGEILPQGIGAHLNSMPRPPAVLAEAQELSQGTKLELSDRQAYSTFHGGCGILIVPSTESDAMTIIEEARKDGIEAQIVGETIRSSHIIIDSRFREGISISSPKPQ